MALELRPNCEWCDVDLPPNSPLAHICSYECTFCQDCVEHVLENVCPNCGDGFSPRPIRPQTAFRQGVSSEFQPPNHTRKHSHYSLDDIKRFAGPIKAIEPQNR